LGPERHRADRLHAAEAVDRVGPGKVLRRDDRRRGPSLKGRRRGDDARHARDLRGDDRHMGRGEQRILPARNVAADALHRDVLVAEHHARQRLDFDILHRRALMLGEVFHLRLRELDVLDVARRELAEAVSDFLVGQAVVVAVPAVEFLRQVAHGVVAAGLDVGEDVLDRRTDAGVVLGDRGGVAPALEPVGHEGTPKSLRGRRP
jgi:hypothetical protein